MFNVGRNNPRVRAALHETLDLETPGAVQLGVSALPGLLGEALLARLPARLGARPLRQLRHRGGRGGDQARPRGDGRPRVLSAEHAFHGLTLGSLSANGCAEFTEPFGPLLPGFDRVPFNDLDALERELAREDVAVFLVEPVQGKGVVLPEPGYLEAAQALCSRYGTLFCVDEVQTGLGRTGRMFAFEHWGLEPDMVTIAKSISGGYVPSGALVPAGGDLDGVFDSLEHAVRHGSTFAPNDLADGGRARDAARARRATASSSARAARRAAARADAPARRALRGRPRGARARPDVGDRVRRAGRAAAAPGAPSSARSRGSSRSSS